MVRCFGGVLWRKTLLVAGCTCFVAAGVPQSILQQHFAPVKPSLEALGKV